MASSQRSREDVRERVRRRRLLRARLRLVGLVLALVSVAVAMYAVPRSGLFAIRQVEIVGASAVPDLLARNRIQPLLEGRTIFTFDGEAVARRLEDLPFVRSVEVQRHFPTGIEVRVREYSPLALGMTRKGNWLIARDGRVLARAKIADWYGRVPVVRIEAAEVHPGDRVGDEPALRLLHSIPPDFPGAISSVEVNTVADSRHDSGTDRFYDITAHVADGPEIRFGQDDDMPQKLLVASRMLTMFGARYRSDIAYLDVSVASRPSVRFTKVPPGYAQ